MTTNFKFDKLKSIVGDDQEAFNKMIGVIKKQLVIDIDKIKLAFDSKDLETIRFNFHSIRSTILYLGADSLAQLAKEIEEKAQKKEMDDDMIHKITIFLQDINNAYVDLKNKFK